ncbi:hypothetical protein QQ054_33415 [Oscillatoria amoena NRMC-F 0135]|nr:hypothetical protein [Oscillatoria amoena NRMC-F 0135]
MRLLFLAPLLLMFINPATAQPALSYYLPDDGTYNQAIPTPKSVIGHEVGEWHIEPRQACKLYARPGQGLRPDYP